MKILEITIKVYPLDPCFKIDQSLVTKENTIKMLQQISNERTVDIKAQTYYENS